MTSRDFAYWLQGFFEITDKQEVITKEQAKIISNHLNLVFLHDIDKQYKTGDGSQEVHDSGKINLFPHNNSLDGLMRC